MIFVSLDLDVWERRRISDNPGACVASSPRAGWWYVGCAGAGGPLLSRPRREPHRPQVWALPKGLTTSGERGLDTAIREVHEETGLRATGDLKLGDVRYVYTWEGERVFKVVSFFLLRAVDGRIGDLPPGMEIEVAEARWVPLDDAPTVLSYGGEREMALKALEAVTVEGFR